MNVILKIEQGPEKGKAYEFTEPDTFLVGRGIEAHFRLSKEDRYVSRKHFMLEVAPPKCYIRDFGSSNGTIVNGMKVNRSELKDGNLIKAGMTEIRVNLNAGAEEEEENLWWDEDDGTSVQAQEKKKSGQEFPAACSDCMEDVSDKANSDGRAYELKDIGVYLCDDCSDMRRTSPVVEEIDDYHLLGEIGGGGSGVVYTAIHKPTARLVALKKIFIEGSSQKAKSKFSRGMRAMEDIVHPNIIRLMDQGMCKGGNYIVSELMEGKNVRQFITQDCKGPASPQVACKVISDVLSGLEYFHQSNHIHRSIKPANILLTRGGRDSPGTAKLGDCGVARCYSDAGGSTITEQGEVSGTIIYMAPEQILDFKNVKEAADTYSAGLILYELLTADIPFQQKAKDPVLIVLEDTPIPIMDKNPSVPKPLAHIVDKSVRKDVKERFASAAEFREEIEKLKAQI